jgi:hypothetical protein
MQISTSRAARLVLSALCALTLGGAACSRAEPEPARVGPTYSEGARIQRHLARVEEALRAADVSHLDRAQRAARHVHLERLRRYREAGRFPHNHVLGGPRRPVFVDSHGTRCAMAHLIESSGGGQLVALIASARNGAYVRELADEPELGDWLQRGGISLAEAAAIQPTYGGGPHGEEEIGRRFALASMGAGVAGGAAIGINLRGDADRGAGWFGVLAGVGGMLVGGPVMLDARMGEVPAAAFTMATVNVGVGLTAALLGARTLLRDDGDAVRPEARRPHARDSVTVVPLAGLVNGLAVQRTF